MLRTRTLPLIIAVMMLLSASSVVIGLNHFVSNDEAPVRVTQFLFITDSTATELSLEVYYEFNFTDDERLVEAALLLSLDNDSFVTAWRHEYDPDLMEANGSAFFWLANAIGDPFPFDLEAGQTLYGYVNFTSSKTLYRSENYALSVPISVERPWLFNIPSSVIIFVGIGLTVLPFVLIAACLIWQRQRD